MRVDRCSPSSWSSSIGGVAEANGTHRLGHGGRGEGCDDRIGHSRIGATPGLGVGAARQRLDADAEVRFGIDDHSDFGQWIAKDVAPEEIQRRVNLAVGAAQQVDPTMRDLMARFYGLSTGDVASYFLDPNRALPVIEHQYQTAGVAAWAQRAGYQITDMTRYEQLKTDGVTAEQAAAGYSSVAELDRTTWTDRRPFGVDPSGEIRHFEPGEVQVRPLTARPQAIPFAGMVACEISK